VNVVLRLYFLRSVDHLIKNRLLKNEKKMASVHYQNKRMPVVMTFHNNN